MSFRIGLVAALVVGLSACKDTQPASIRFGASPLLLQTTTPTTFPAQVLNKSLEVLPGVPLSYSAVPADVVTVSAAGNIQCLKSGDASVVVTGSGVSTALTVRCQLVKALIAPFVFQSILGNVPAPLQPLARDETGKPIPGIAVNLSNSAPDVADWKDGKVIPKKVGRAVLTWTAGSATTVTAVTVVQKIKAEPLIIKDGAVLNQSLGQGLYQVEIDVRAANGGRDGLTLNWVGTPCPGVAETQHIKTTCNIPNAGSMILTNPTTFGMGPAVEGEMLIYLMPPVP